MNRINEEIKVGSLIEVYEMRSRRANRVLRVELLADGSALKGYIVNRKHRYALLFNKETYRANWIDLEYIKQEIAKGNMKVFRKESN